MSIPDETENIYTKIAMMQATKIFNEVTAINYRELGSSFIEKSYSFLEEYSHFIIIVLHLVMLFRHMSRSRYHSIVFQQKLATLKERQSRFEEATDEYNRKSNGIDDDRKRLNAYKSNHDAGTAMKAALSELVEKCQQLDNIGKDWRESWVNIAEIRIADLEKKNKDIEDIMIDGLYNDPQYLAYEGDEWTFAALQEKALEMGIPSRAVYWGSKPTLSYVLRVVEQLTKIGDIVKPVYPDGYETEEWPGSQTEKSDGDEVAEESGEEEMKEESDGDEVSEESEEEDYLDDPDWIPNFSDEDDSEEDWEKDSEPYHEYDEKETENAERLLCTMVTLAQSSDKKSYFFESVKSPVLERLIKSNGLRCSFEHHPSPGYTLTGYLRGNKYVSTV